ncbi:hypothetical protein HY969_04880 [Candidatus Kaiserbacteria bacterium]|nr:hypothetical protein [Candidatus Kaiserbacteria bacterium]
MEEKDRVPRNQDLHPDAAVFLERVIKEHGAGVRSADVVIRTDLEGATTEEQLQVFLELYNLACGGRATNNESERSRIAAAALILATRYPAIEALYDDRFDNPGYMRFWTRQTRLKGVLKLSEKASITWATLRKRMGM